MRLALMLEELLLPGGDEQALERPRISHYCASFRLPGVLKKLLHWGCVCGCTGICRGELPDTYQGLLSSCVYASLLLRERVIPVERVSSRECWTAAWVCTTK